MPAILSGVQSPKIFAYKASALLKSLFAHDVVFFVLSLPASKKVRVKVQILLALS